MIDGTNDNYNHTGARLSARKLEVNNNAILSVDNNLLVVTNNLNIADGSEIRLVGTSQLIQSHTGVANLTGNGKVYIDQQSDLASVYHYNYMSSPVTTLGENTYTIASVFKDGTTPLSANGTVGQNNGNIAKDIAFTGDFDGSIGNPVGNPINISTRWLYTFASDKGKRASWVRQGQNSTIPATDGFIFKGPGVVQNYTFVGNPNDGKLTTSIAANDSYLIGNPFASALNAKRFIYDNLDQTDGTLYFWDHVGEEDASTDTSGHNYAGYIGGYATINLSMGVPAVTTTGAVDIDPFTIDLESENATSNKTPIVYDDKDVVLLNAVNDYVEFTVTKAADKIKIYYSLAASTQQLFMYIDDVPVQTEIDNNVFTPFVLLDGSQYSVHTISDLCVTVGSVIKLESQTTSPIYIDKIEISDDDGNVPCSPATGTDASVYKTPGYYVPVGQGFFIGGNTTVSGLDNIEFNNSHRIYKPISDVVGEESVFFKNGTSKKVATNSTPIIKLGMNFNNIDDGKNYHRQIGVSFNSKNSFDFDKGYDSQINDIGATDFYWKFPNNEGSYVIAGVQEVSTDLEVPLEITMGYSGEVTLKVDEMKNVNNNVYITDKVTGNSYEIIDGKATLTLNQGIYSDRFVLAFKPSSALSVDDDIINGYTSIYADNKDKLLVITKEQDITIDKVQIYSILGKEVGVWNINEQKQKLELKIGRQLPTAIYIVKLKTDKGNISKKIVIE